jgi:predicted alpha/beta superfamily hydrolase
MIRKLIVFTIIFFATANASAQETTATKQVSTFNIEAPQLHSTKKIWIYLPKNYDAAKKKYPVIYMHDAQNLFDAKTSFVGEWNVDEKLDSLKAQVIVVGIEHGNDKRIDELTPYKNAKYGGGNADNYLEFIVNNLKPKIDAQYRTKPNAGNTAIMGSSLGGLTSFYAILKYPKVFGKAGVFSPSFDYSKDIYTATENTKKIKAKIYFLYGDNEDVDMVPNMNKMDVLLAEKRCECQHLTKKRMVKGGQHNEKLWRDGFVKAYLWLF